VKWLLAGALLLPGVASACEDACDASAAATFAVDYFSATLAPDCEAALAAVGANAEAMRKCRTERRLPGLSLREEHAKRLVFRFKELQRIKGVWIAIGEFEGPDTILFGLKLANNNYCESVSWTDYPGLNSPGEQCGAGFWDDLPSRNQPVAVLLDCEHGRWRPSAMTEREFLQRIAPGEDARDGG
jgi:hypothetical protein